MDNFREFVLDASFWITSIACFSIWENECENIENDIDGVELLLWQVRKCLVIGTIMANCLIIKQQKISGCLWFKCIKSIDTHIII